MNAVQTRRTPPVERERSIGALRPSSPVGAGSHRHPTDRYLDRATMAEITHLLDEHGATEPGREFFCIRCQKTQRDQVMHGPAAVIVDAVNWRCSNCAKTGTRWHLVNAVRFRPTALRRLDELLAG